uniref:Uncharacterized protein n=1 Tax=Arundo donax TaxID=35708 RepID=A0A0A9B707_ARUDO
MRHGTPQIGSPRSPRPPTALPKHRRGLHQRARQSRPVVRTHRFMRPGTPLNRTPKLLRCICC